MSRLPRGELSVINSLWGHFGKWSNDSGIMLGPGEGSFNFWFADVVFISRRIAEFLN
jgi:hypothetical protein